MDIFTYVVEDHYGDGELGFKVGLWGIGCSDVDLISCPSAVLIRHANISCPTAPRSGDQLRFPD